MDIQSVITKEEFDELELSYEKLCELLTRLVKLAVEESLRTLPSVVTHLSKQTAYLRTLSNDFYETNKDLASNKEFVAQIIETVEAKNPGKKYDEILKLAATEARSKLKELSSIKAFPKSRELRHLDGNLRKLQ